MATNRTMPPMGLVVDRQAALTWTGRPSRVGQALRAAWRGGAALAWTGVACVVQSLLLLLAGRAKVVFARVYWSVMCRIMGLQVRIIGAPIPGGQPAIFASNHSSWLDILVLGGRLEACFVAKAEVGRWPVIRTVARLGRTVFVSRRPGDISRERDGMRARLAAGDSLILFPEGTSSDGSRVLPFRSAFFSVVEDRGNAAPTLIQPVSIVYDRLAGLPAGRTSRPVLAWYGDMELGSHFWRLARYRGLRATIILHPPIDPGCHTSRKDVSVAVWQTVASGAASLRQNRPWPPGASFA